MEIFISILLILIGLVLIVKGGDLFVTAAIDIAKKTKIPEIIIGATIVSFATALPELIVSIISASSGSYGLAVGNAVGSIMCNTALICGISIAVMPSKLEGKSNYKFLMLIATMLFVLVFSLNRSISYIEGIVLLVGTIIFFASNFVEARKMLKASKGLEKEEPYKALKTWKTVLYFFLGTLGIGLGAYLLVENATILARMMGVSNEFIGLTIVAIGTSLPELITTITAIRKKSAGLGIGNIVGANIINGTLLVGLSAVISGRNGLPIDSQTLYITIPVMILATLILVIPIIFKRKTYRIQGIAMLLIYLSYLIFLILATILNIKF